MRRRRPGRVRASQRRPARVFRSGRTPRSTTTVRASYVDRLPRDEPLGVHAEVRGDAHALNFGPGGEPEINALLYAAHRDFGHGPLIARRHAIDGANHIRKGIEALLVRRRDSLLPLEEYSLRNILEDRAVLPEILLPKQGSSRRPSRRPGEHFDTFLPGVG